MDRWGRIRLPEKFLKPVIEKYGNEVFVTSIDSKTVSVYPEQVWLRMASIASEKSKNRSIEDFMRLANRNGVKTQIDEQGRILVHKMLREMINLKGDLLIEGKEDYLALSKKK